MAAGTGVSSVTIWRGRSASVGTLVLAMAVLLALLLALPGQTVTTKYLNDLFLILDGVHRVASGQVPSRDFHTPLGPLVFYIPALGYGLSGSLGGALPTGLGIFILILTPVLVHVLASRLRPVVALPFAAILLLILAVPINLGEGVTALSFAKFYNRIGWVALGLLLVMYLRPAPDRAQSDWLDAASAAFLTLVMIYTKATYGAVALAFLVFLLVDVRQRRWVALALGMVVLAALGVEAFWGSSSAYLADLMLTHRVSGSPRGTFGQIVDHILGNFADYVLVGLFAGLALHRTRSIRDALFYGFCAVTGFLIINQNFQAWGIVTLHAAAAVAAETVLRAADHEPEPVRADWSVTAGAKLLFLALVLPTSVHCLVALGLHATAATARAGSAIALPNLDRARIANLWTWSEYDGATQYLATIKDGTDALAGLGPSPGKVLVLDLANPFSAGLGLVPPHGDMPWLQWGRTVGANAFLPADELLADVGIVMEPKPPVGDSSADEAGLVTLYGDYLAANFDIVRETEHWKVHRRRQPSTRIGGMDSSAGRMTAQVAGP